MRAVHLNDVLRLVRVLIAAPDAQREALCKEVFRAVELADRRVKGGVPRTLQEPKGTLTDALCNRPSAHHINLDNPSHCACFELALAHLRTRPRSNLL